MAVIKDTEENINKMIDSLTERAGQALDGYMQMNQEQVDRRVHARA